jgi:hypothetical protein
LVNISFFQYRLNAGMNPGGEGGKAASESADLFHGPDIFHEAPVVRKAGQQLLNGERWHTLPAIRKFSFCLFTPFRFLPQAFLC